MAGTALIYLFYAVYFGLCKLSCSTLMKTDVLLCVSGPLKRCRRKERLKNFGLTITIKLFRYDSHWLTTCQKLARTIGNECVMA